MIGKNNKKVSFKNNKKKTCLVADIAKIKKLGWKPKISIFKILKELK